MGFAEKKNPKSRWYKKYRAKREDIMPPAFSEAIKQEAKQEKKLSWWKAIKKTLTLRKKGGENDYRS